MNRQLHGDLMQLPPGTYPDKDPRLQLRVGTVRQFQFTRTFMTVFRGKTTTSEPVVFLLGSVPEMGLATARKHARFIGALEKNIKLNRTIIEKIPPVEGDFWFNDTEVPGLRLRVRQTKAFYLEKRIKHTKGSPLKMHLADFDAKLKTLLDDVRDRARAYINLRRQGIDPRQTLAAESDVPVITLRIAYDKFRDIAKLEESTKAIYDGYVDNHLACWLDTSLTEITEDVLIDFFDRAPCKGQAYKSLKMFGAMWKKVRRRFLHKDKPILGPSPWVEAREEIDFRPAEPEQVVIPIYRVGEFVAKLERLIATHPHIAETRRFECFLLCLFTGLRISEAYTLEWEHVHLNDGFLKVTRVRAKNKRDHFVPFSSYVAEFFARKRRNRVVNSPYVFPALTNPNKPLHKQGRSNLKIMAMMDGMKWEPHACRRTFSSAANELDIPEARIGVMLNHSLGANAKTITARYIVKSFNPQKSREDFQRVCDFLLEKRDQYLAHQVQRLSSTA